MKFLNSSFVLLLTVVSSCKMQFDTAVISENKDIILSAQESYDNLQLINDSVQFFKKVI